jgi:7-cyano-7-deazaguanine synthase
MQRKAIVLVSGGLDSATVLALAKAEGFEVFALSFRYGQRHEAELLAAARVVETIGVSKHVVAQIDLRVFGDSALTSDDIAVPKGRSLSEMNSGIPVTYVPARNTVFLSFALAWAEAVGAGDIFIGVNALDYSGYPDCRMAYIAAFEHMAGLATRAGVEGHGVRIHAPLIAKTKAQIIREGIRLGVDYANTSTCYDPDKTGAACGRCDACQLRRGGFEAAGVPDPTRYA